MFHKLPLLPVISLFNQSFLWKQLLWRSCHKHPAKQLGPFEKVVTDECREIGGSERYVGARINRDLWFTDVWDESDREMKGGIDISFSGN